MGRSVKRHRSPIGSICGIGAVIVICGSAIAGKPPCYDVTAVVPKVQCPGDDPVSASPISMNDRGDVVGFYACIGAYDHAIAWWGSSGPIDILDLTPEETNSRAWAINNNRVICGTVALTGNEYGDLGFVLAGSELSIIQPFEGGTQAWALAINGSSQVTGYAGDNVDGDPPWTTFLWEDGVMTDLGPTMEAHTSRGADINDPGVITGNRRIEEGSEAIGFIWEDGEVTDLGPIAGGYTSEPEAINNKRQVVGRGRVGVKGEYQWHPFLWSDGEMTDLGLLPGYTKGYARDINDGGVIVGDCDVADDPCIGFLWQDGTMYDLNDLLTPDCPAKLIVHAKAIDRNGNILTKGLYNGYKGLILSPVYSSITDLDGDCDTTVSDLLILLGEWSKTDSPADFNEDGIVDVQDLLALLAHWG